MNPSFQFIFCSLIILLSFSCQETYDKDQASYLHIAHTRAYTGAMDKAMKEVEELNYKKYDVLMLGGDLVYESTGEKATLAYLDTIFDLSNPNTLWTLGNHDYHNHPEWIPEITRRPNAYAFEKYGITYLVLDAQEDNCNLSGLQKELFDQTIKNLKSNTTHLIVLHHKLLWMMDNGPMREDLNSVTNGGHGGCFHCIPDNNFYGEVYPSLLKVKERGVQVICIAGDIGGKVNTYEFKDEKGIHFLASGLRDGAKDNRVLLFDHDIKNQKLTWKFEPLKNLLSK